MFNFIYYLAFHALPRTRNVNFACWWSQSQGRCRTVWYCSYNHITYVQTVTWRKRRKLYLKNCVTQGKLLQYCKIVTAFLMCLVTLTAWNVQSALDLTKGGDSSVGIATCYGLDGPGIESRWGRDFPHPSRPALGPTQPPVQWVPGLSPGVKRPGSGADYPTSSKCRGYERVGLYLYSPTGPQWPCYRENL